MSHYQFCLHNKLYPESPTYNIPSVFRIRGDLNIPALHQSVEIVLGRHDVFRMTFPDQRNMLEPRLHDRALFLFDEIELNDQTAADQLEQFLNEEIVRPFNLGGGPLIRFHLFSLKPKDFVLLIVMHHCITDLRSKELLGIQLSTCYNSILSEKEEPVQTFSPQYSSYLGRMAEWLPSLNANRMREFWKEELRDCEGLLQLPLDHPRPSTLSNSGKAHFFQVPPEQAEIMRRACQRMTIAPFVALLACFIVLLARYSRQKTIVVGVPLSNRRHEEDKTTLGCYVNILPLTVELDDDTTIMQVIRMVRRKMLLAHRNQELPFHEIVSAVQPQREPSYNPIFQAGFTHEPPMVLQLSGLTVVSQKAHNHGAQMDLFLNLYEISTGIEGYFEYDQALFEGETIERISRHYERLVTSWPDHAEQEIDKLELLSSEEKSKVLLQWNDTGKDYGQTECVHRLIEQQAARTPASPALVFNDVVLTYREFNERVNQLAHYLISKGTGPEDIVAVFMERSIEMVIALHGIMKAGAAYLPLEPDLPEQRLSFILAESKARLLLTQEELHDRLLSFNGTILELDTQRPEIDGEPKENPRSTVTPDNLAYIIYTSGSTGKPKGVMIEHRGLFNRLMWMQDAYGLTADDRVLQKTPYGFDVSVWEFFWSFMTGATLVVAPPDVHRDPVKLCQVIRQQEITTIHFVPSMLHLFLQADEASDCTSIRLVFCSGEALSWSLRSDFLQKLDCQLHNLYGPTEATVDVSYWDCRSQTYPGKVPIGYPVANTQLYILDDNLQPVPIGVVGDLYIGGVQVARGYLEREDLTRGRFIPDPYDQSGKGRLYKTGDLSRYLPDGAIEYMGRADFQVKLFGNRIELTEIEAALRSHPEIDDAVVALFGEDKERQQLVAYLLTKVTNLDELKPKKHLMEILPYYMVPNRYLLMAEFPLTGSGKTNRKKLPPIELLVESSPPDFSKDQAIDQDHETLILDIWKRVLNVDEVDVDCNFFDAGGSSLQVAELAVALEERLGVSLPLVKVFQYPTVSALAEFLEDNQ